MVACAPQKSEPDKTIAQLLEERLDSIQKKGYMAGHQDDPFYGIGWAYEDGKSDVDALFSYLADHNNADNAKAKAKYGDKFFVTLVQDGCSACEADRRRLSCCHGL